jgi:type II secretory pathway pseudopilin PulG
MIELLVVIAIIGILASMVLTAVARAKRQVYVATCLDNLRQIGLALQMFANDQQHYATSLGGQEIPDEFASGASLESRLAEMRARSLFSYINPYSKTWKCPEDKGLDFRPAGPSDVAGVNIMPPGPFFGPTAHFAFGLSYRLNTVPWVNTKFEAAGVLPGQSERWVKQPSEYIYFSESPAQPMRKVLLEPDLFHLQQIREPYNYFHWHFNTGPSSVFDIATDKQRAISPILFVDGHAANLDFTQSLHDDWRYPSEATKDWMWYQPAIGPNGQPIPVPEQTSSTASN